jgi:hypothetical protein
MSDKIDKGMKGWIPLAAWRLKYKYISEELLWSWFRAVVEEVSIKYNSGITHGNISDETMLIKTSDNPKSAGYNICRLIESNSNSTSENIDSVDDLMAIHYIFSGLIRGDENLNNKISFRQILLQIEDGDFENCSDLWNHIKPFVRLSQIEIADPIPAKHKGSWKKWVLIIFPSLFIVSLIVAFFAPGPGDGDDKNIVKTVVKIPLKSTPQNSEITVEHYKGKWDKSFPLHRVAGVSDGYIYFNLKYLDEYKGKSLLKKGHLLGLPSKLPCREKSISCFSSFTISNDSWDTKFPLLMEKTLPEKNSTELPKWRSVFNRNDSILKIGANPAVLNGISGILLSKTGYNPANISKEIFIIYWKLPGTPPPERSIWSSLFGGILPTTFLIRIFKTAKGLKFIGIADFTTPMDSKMVEKQMQNLLLPLLPLDKTKLIRNKSFLNLSFPLSFSLLKI